MQFMSAFSVCERELMLNLIWFHSMRRCDTACVGQFLISCREKSRGLGLGFDLYFAV